jgi:hypothetical protein
MDLRQGTGLVTAFLVDGRCYQTDLATPSTPFVRVPSQDLSLEQAEKNLIELEAARIREEIADQDALIERADLARESARLAELEAAEQAKKARAYAETTKARLQQLEGLKP